MSLDKLRKLLRLAKNSAASPAEAATAMAKALELAAELGVSPEGVDLRADDAPRGALSHATVATPKGTAERLAATLTAEQFLCRYIWDDLGKPKIHFIGPPAYVEVAGYCYTYLRKAMVQAWNKRANRRLKDRSAFLSGFASAIRSTMPDQFRNHAMVSAEEASEYATTKIVPGATLCATRARKSRTFSARAATHGYFAGRSAGIRNALT